MKISSLTDLDILVEKYSSIVVVADKNSAKYTLPILNKNSHIVSRLPKTQIILIDGREQSKDINTVVQIWKKFEELHLDRSAVVINLGGGVVSDVAGFAASTYKRGIPYINIPTTLLAMVDASIGGKTAINVNGVKNLAGVFALPAAVFIYIEFLDTLPLKEKMSGFAEIIKMYAVTRTSVHIKNLSFLIKSFSYPQKKIKPIERHLKTRFEKHIEEAIYFSAKQKEKIISKDFKEQGLRKTLNFGHTVGHAIESLLLSRNTPITHGEAIMWGMVAELYLSVKLLNFPQEDYNQFKMFAHEYYPSLQGVISKKDLPRLMSFMRNDKKNSDDKIFPILLSNYGTCYWDIPVNEGYLIESITQLL